ncbi:DUF1508 domain-containing protein [Streptomyces sp. NPDC023588]|uniref:DUF1508 domain-containing protein n=1 Tax=Streptomyces sp. NPDC023588 TaxID=3154907 RepID=UPI0033DE6C24
MHISSRGGCHGDSFEVRHQPGKGCHFVLIATKGAGVVTSEHDESDRACLYGIDSVKRNADAPRQDTTSTNQAR